MAADFAALSQRLEADAATGAITLDRRVFPQRHALWLIDRLLGVEVLYLDEASVQAAQTRIFIRGRASLLRLERCRCDIEIGSDMALTIELFPPDGWRLGWSFTALVGSEFETFIASDQTLTLRSHAADGSLVGIRDALEYSGMVALGRYFFGLGRMLGTLAQARMHGPIRIARQVHTHTIDTAETLDVPRLTDPGVPLELEFKAPLPTAFKIPNFQLHGAQLVIAGPHVVDWAPYPDVAKSMRAQLTVGGYNVTVEGGASAGGRLSLSARPENLVLPGLQAISDLAPGVDFADALPRELGVFDAIRVTDIDVVINVKSRSLSHLGVGLQAETDWEIASGFASVDRINVYLMASDLGRKSCRIDGSISTDLVVGDIAANVTAYAPEFIFTASIPDLPLSATITRFAPALQSTIETLPEIDLSDVHISIAPKSGQFSLRAVSDAEWKIPVGIDGLVIRDLLFEINRQPGKKRGKVGSVSGLISGMMQIGDATIEVEYAFPGDFVLRGNLPEIDFSPLLRHVAGTSVLRDTPIPDSVLNATLEDIFFVIAPGRRHFQLAARMGMGEAEILIKKTSRGSWGCALGVAISPDWKLSELAPGLGPLDDLELGGAGIILSTTDDDSMALSVVNPSRPQVEINRDQLGMVEPQALGSRIQKGLNLFVNMSLLGTGADELLKIENLQVYAAIGSNPLKMTLEARIDGRIPLGPDAFLSGIAFRLQPLSTNPSITLLGVIELNAGDDQLRFTGAVQVSPRDAEIAATMQGDWTEPLGFPDLTISDVGLSGGLSFVTLLPTIGIAGSLQVGTVAAKAAVRFDTGKPEHSMVAATMNRLMVIDVVDAFCTDDMSAAVPAEARRMLATTGMEDVNIHLVPMPCRIGELQYPQGIRIKGRMFLPGFRAEADIQLDPERGIKVFGAMTPIEIAGVFKIDGARGEPGPSLNIQLQRGEPFVVLVQGFAQVLGIEGEVFVNINQSGFEFELEGKICDLFEAHIFAKGGRLDSDVGFYLLVEMQNDLMEYLRAEATRAIEAVADAALHELNQAQDVLEVKQAKLSGLDQEIAKMRKAVERDRKRDQKNLANARRDVQNAQREVNRIGKAIEAARAQVRRERTRDANRLRSARQGVFAAQGEVNKLQAEIDSSKVWIGTLNGQINAKKVWLDNKAWYDKGWAGIEFAAFSAAKGTEITAVYTKIGGIETAKGTAWAALEVAKATVREMERAAVSIPVDADPRVSGLFAGHGAATLALTASIEFLRGIVALSRSFPIDADPRVSSLIAGRETVWIALEGAKQGLQVANGGVDGIADVSSFIVKAGLGGLIDIKRIRFETSVSASRGGMFDLQIELSFQGSKPELHRLSFDFDNPLLGAQRLAGQLLTG